MARDAVPASRVIAQLAHHDSVSHVERTQGDDHQVTVYLEDSPHVSVFREAREKLGWNVSGVSKDHPFFWLSDRE